MAGEAFRLTASEAAGRIRAGTLTPRRLMESCLERVADREPTVHAFAHLDRTAALAASATCHEGLLQGLPIGVKDVLDTADMPSEYGSEIWRGHRPRADAACVALARAAGAVAMGKTVTTEFATRRPGPTTNPHDAQRTPGGSSSGSAAAVADFMVPLAFATQTAGSIIRPAAYCGVVGYKPSYGTLPRLGMKVMSESLDTIGAMARSVADCAMFLAALTGGEPADGEPDRAPRIGFCQTFMWPEAGSETVALLDTVISRLGRAGASVTTRELPAPFAALRDAHPVVMNAESALSMAWERAHHKAGISAGLREKLEWGRSQGPPALDAARKTLRDLQDAFAPVMDGVDILLTPSAPGEAPLGLEWTGDPAFNYIWTALHVPCITLPAGQGPHGLPLGIQLIAARGQDRALLTWAEWVQQALVS